MEEQKEALREEEELNAFFLAQIREGCGPEEILDKAKQAFPGFSRGGLLALFRDFLARSRDRYCDPYR